MTGRAMFSQDEWDLLVRLPRWVVRAASASQPDNDRRTFIETEAGFISVAEGRTMGNELVKEIAQATMAVFDQPQGLPEAAGISFADLETGLTRIIEQAQAAVAVMEAKAATDADTYRRWLLYISDVVISAARSHDTFGIGGVYVTKREQSFDVRLEQALGRQ